MGKERGDDGRDEGSRMKTLAAALAVILAFAGLVVYAPHYLFYADAPRRADAVVLFLGNEYRERRAEAVKLMAEGYAGYLVIPAYGRVAEAGKHGEASRNVVPSRPSHYPVVYEDTHIEIIEAKRLMDGRGLTSAIFVVPLTTCGGLSSSATGSSPEEPISPPSFRPVSRSEKRVSGSSTSRR